MSAQGAERNGPLAAGAAAGTAAGAAAQSVTRGAAQSTSLPGVPSDADFEAARTAFTAGVQAFEACDLSAAEARFLEALRLVPGRPSALVNLAAVRHRLGRPAEALAALEQALAAQRDDVPAWFHHGQLLQMLERPGDALRSYERVLALDTRHGAAWTQRGSLLKDMGRFAEAAECFRQALAHGGDAELNRYFLASVRPGPGRAPAPRALAGGPLDASMDASLDASLEAPPAAPRHYVEALFDSYAEGFDEHLVGKLGYRTPWLIAEMLPGRSTEAQESPSGAKRWRAALDLGCGTGLMGPLLAPRCEAVDGIDLSTLMLGKAQALGCYRRLVHGDVAEHLHGTTERHDLVVAADVFVYIGDLAAVFGGAARVLDAGGLFAFSVEEATAGVERFELRASSRYAHSEAYVRQLAASHGFELRALTRTTLRHDQRQPIGGLLALLARR
ncbi:MAG: tetratricopeptide repeat protein [Rubrivivax sp.]|nr:tetratricopeptide repeat protein [Rubrivivax sp.]